MAAIYVYSFDFHLYIPLPTGHLTRHAYIHSSLPLSRSHGCSLARVLAARRPHLKLVTSLQGRSQATISRAESCGLINVPFADLIAQSDVILSILPPSSAVSLAKKVIAHVKPEKKPIFIDVNAISPETAAQISSIFEAEDIPFIDGCIIGFPATEDFSSIPKLYLSASAERENLMQEVVQTLSGGEGGKGMKVRPMEGSGVGGASALKMCYGGINKAVSGLAAAMVLCMSNTCLRRCQ